MRYEYDLGQFIKDNYEFEKFSGSPLAKFINELNEIHRSWEE